MSLYVSAATIATFMPQLPVDGESGYTATALVIAQAVEQAEALVDGHIGTKYSLPIDSEHIPPLLREIATGISVHKAYSYLYPGDNVASNVFSEKYEAWEKNSYAMLEMLQENKLVLTLTDGSILSTKTSTRAIKSSHGKYTPIFDMDDADTQGVDPDRLEDIASKR